uniref:Uncharacterized protein n=1 Tax=Aureoumbra lagunensis TaxID=44058 RepID=A0A7S3K1F6_9STRA
MEYPGLSTRVRYVSNEELDGCGLFAQRRENIYNKMRQAPFPVKENIEQYRRWERNTMSQVCPRSATKMQLTDLTYYIHNIQTKSIHINKSINYYYVARCVYFFELYSHISYDWDDVFEQLKSQIPRNVKRRKTRKKVTIEKCIEELSEHCSHEGRQIITKEYIQQNLEQNCFNKLRPHYRRKRVSGGIKNRSYTFGVVYAPFYKRSRTSNLTEEYAELTKLLVNFGKQRLPHGTTFTSITINLNLRTKPHIDAYNVGPSYIIGFGTDVKGGGLWTLADGILDIFGEHFVQFDGTMPHATMEFTGKRITLVYYTARNLIKIPPDEIDRLRDEFGFPLPKQSEDTRPPLLEISSTVRMHAAAVAFEEFINTKHDVGAARAKAEEIFCVYRAQQPTAEMLALVGNIFKSDDKIWRIVQVYYHAKFESFLVDYYNYERFSDNVPPYDRDESGEALIQYSLLSEVVEWIRESKLELSRP